MRTQAGPTPIKFLVVDDVQSNLDAMSALLQRDGLEIHCTTSGREALELLLVHEYALALLDVQMPEIGGFELAELMRSTARTRSIPIVFITGGVADPVREFRGYDAGAVAFLVKPVAPHVLRNKAATFFELARQRQELQILADELQQTLQFNETFVAAVTHDLRTPLGTITMAAEILGDGITDPASAKAVAMLRSSAGRMKAMIDALTDLARARLSGGIAVARADVDAHELARAIVGEAATSHPGQRFDLDLVGDPHAHWDRDQVGRVLANLVGNALRHGAPKHPVRVGVDGRERDHVRLEVVNRGTIAEPKRARLFEPFSRDRDSRGEGLGLGLYIVKQIALAHGGRVEARTGEADETAFAVILPRGRGDHG